MIVAIGDTVHSNVRAGVWVNKLSTIYKETFGIWDRVHLVMDSNELEQQRIQLQRLWNQYL